MPILQSSREAVFLRSELAAAAMKREALQSELDIAKLEIERLNLRLSAQPQPLLSPRMLTQVRWHRAGRQYVCSRNRN